MKSVNKEILGFNVAVTGVAETLSELEAACGNSERAVELANSYIMFHVHFSKVRAEIIKFLEGKTGIKRETKTVGEGDDAKQVITEKEAEYIGRLEDQVAGGLSQYNEEVASLVAAMPIDYTKSTTSSVPTAPAKKWLAYYDGLVEAGKLEAFIAKHNIAVDGLTDEAIKLAVVTKVKDLVTKATQAALAGATDV